jgi:hypothetical protein
MIREFFSSLIFFLILVLPTYPISAPANTSFPKADKNSSFSKQKEKVIVIITAKDPTVTIITVGENGEIIVPQSREMTTTSTPVTSHPSQAAASPPRTSSPGADDGKDSAKSKAKGGSSSTPATGAGKDQTAGSPFSISGSNNSGLLWGDPSLAFASTGSKPVLEQIAPNPKTYMPNDPAGFYTMAYSGSGEVMAQVQPVDVIIPPVGGSTSGCEAADFADFTPGNIALIQRGSCTFQQKAANAETAGAVGVIIFNEGDLPNRMDAMAGTLGAPGITIPVVGTSFAIGQELNNLALDGGVIVHLKVDKLTDIAGTLER